MSNYVYLDWNVFNKIEKIHLLDTTEQPIYSSLLRLITEQKIHVPYSNAHMSDLHRGYLKNNSYALGHLNTIKQLTNDLCIVQYWGEKVVKWHYRDPHEFFESTIDESNYTAESFSKLMDFEDNTTATALWELKMSLLKMQKIPENFKQIYSIDPVFNMLYPRTKSEMNMHALCEDLYDFGYKIKKDYNLYKQYRKYLNQCRVKFPQYASMINSTEKNTIGEPSNLTWNGLWDQIEPVHTSNNKSYDKIINLFTTDLKGYSQDEKFANLMDDAIHTFYAAHCKYFITTDDRCYKKARKVYDTLGIKTSVVKPNDFFITA